MKHEIIEDVVAEFSIDDDDPVSVFIHFTIYKYNKYLAFLFDKYLF